MSDGRIKIDIEVDGKKVDAASKSLDNLGASGQDAGKGVKDTEDGLKGAGNESEKAGGKVKKFATALGLVAIGTAAFQTLKASMDDAIKRFDTLNNFPKVLQALGVSAEDSERAMSKLSDGIDGLPTKLDEISSVAQRMYTSFGDMDKATDSALALNNALLGSGASAADAQRGTEQYLQALQTGKMDMEQWRTLQETMDVGLIKVAESFGYAGQSAKDDLYKALQDGTITMDQFNDKLIEVGTGTGIMAKLAKENSLGIETSLGNLRNAAARGIASILDSFNKLSKEVTGKDIAQNIDGLKHVVTASFNTIGNIIEATTPLFKLFGSAVGEIMPFIKPLTPVLVGMGTAIASLMIVRTVGNLMKSFGAAVAGVTVVQKAAAVATTASAVAYNTFTGRVVAARIAQTTFTTATAGLRTAMLAITGPVGWATIGIGALAGATVGIVKWFNRSSEEGERLKSEVEKMGEATDSLTKSIDSNTDAYRDQIRDIEANNGANDDLLKTLDELSGKENKSKEDKQKLKATVDQLNGSVEGLNLMYNEESDKLSESSDKIKTRINLMKDLETGQAAQERYSEILQDQNKVEEQLNDVIKKKNGLLVKGKLTTADAVVASEELTEQEEALRVKLAELGNQKKTTEQQMVAAQEAIQQAIKDGNANMIVSYGALDEAQEAAFEQMKNRYTELKDAATDAFQRINDESSVTATEMIENLEHNQEMVAAWGENHGQLMEWASKNGHEGFMLWLDTLGVDSAAELQTVADMSEEQLEIFAGKMGEGAEIASASFKDSLGAGLGEVGDILVSMVEDGAMTTAEAIEAADFYSLFGVLPSDATAGIKDGEEKVVSASAGIVGAIDSTVTAGISEANFHGKGKNITEGLQSGMNEGSLLVQTSAKGLARTAADAFMSEAEINSPSRVFTRLGRFLADGVMTGINDGESNVLNSVLNMFSSMLRETDRNFNLIINSQNRSIRTMERSLQRLPQITQISMRNMLMRLSHGGNLNVREMQKISTSMVRAYNGLNSKFYSVGTNAMAGLNSGLHAGTGRVMSTARNIANNVARTMQRALRIHSPSRKMRDDVGKHIPSGLALGIRENAKLAYQEMQKLSKNIIKPVSPEIALGTNRMIYSGNNSMEQAVKNIKLPESKGNSRSYSPTINNYWTREESKPSETTRLQKQQQQRLAMEMGF